MQEEDEEEEEEEKEEEGDLGKAKAALRPTCKYFSRCSAAVQTIREEWEPPVVQTAPRSLSCQNFRRWEFATSWKAFS